MDLLAFWHHEVSRPGRVSPAQDLPSLSELPETDRIAVALLRLINPNLGLLLSLAGNCQVIAIEIRAKKAGASTGTSRDLCNALISFGGSLLDNINETFPTRN